LLVLWQRALDEEQSDLSDEDKRVEEARSEAKQEISLSSIGIHDVFRSVPHSLWPARVKVDGLYVGIVD
jgi:hypothetical protein